MIQYARSSYFYNNVYRSHLKNIKAILIYARSAVLLPFLDINTMMLFMENAFAHKTYCFQILDKYFGPYLDCSIGFTHFAILAAFIS